MVLRLRTALGMTQQQFADKLNLSLASVGRYETNAKPDGWVLEKLGRVAQEAELPVLEAFFKEQLGSIADAELLQQEIASTGLLLEQEGKLLKAFQFLPHDTPKAEFRLRSGFVALAILTTAITEQQLSIIEATLSYSVQQIADFLHIGIWKELTSRDPEIERRRMAFLKDPTRERYREWLSIELDRLEEVLERGGTRLAFWRQELENTKE